MVLADGYVLLRRVGDAVYITELDRKEVIPKRRIMKLDRFLAELELQEGDEA